MRGHGDTYRDWMGPDASLAEAVRSLGAGLTGIPDRGLWLDTSTQTPQQTVEQILADDMQASRY